MIKINIGPFEFIAKFESKLAPLTCSKFKSLLPFTNKIIQARWSGEAGWIPLGETDLGLPLENEKSNPGPGEVLFYPKGISETEILFPYGQSIFACKNGVLSGSHFLTIIEGKESFSALGELILWQGAQEITMSFT
jgi:hypothetical protein